jgi:large subunit ribosomal protein L17
MAVYACSIRARRQAAPPPPLPTTWRSKAMRHRKAGRQLRRTSEQKLALMRNLASSLIEHGSIETTEAKAKELRPFVEKLITKARAGTLHARRHAVRHVHKRETADKLFQELGPKFAKRPGGYTRILKTGHRKGDGAEMARIELVEG